MTATEFREALDALNLSLPQAAKVLGIHHTSVHRYWRGELPVPALVAKYLMLLMETAEDGSRPSSAVVEQQAATSATPPQDFSAIVAEYHPHDQTEAFWLGVEAARRFLNQSPQNS